MRRILLICVVVQVLLGIQASKIYLIQHNTLHANGRWTSTKTRLERGLMGAFSFVTERQSLAGGSLNLGAWHGFQEVFFHRTVGEIESIEFRFWLARTGSVVALFDGEPEGGASGVRFGTTSRHPSAFLEVTGEGEFRRRDGLDETAVEPNVWHRARLDFEGERVAVRVDGRDLGRFAHQHQPDRLVGFRGGGREPVLVDDVEIALVGGDPITETFGTPGSVLKLGAAISAGLLALAAGLLVLLARNSSDQKTLGFRFLMVNLTMLVIGALLFVFVLLRAGSYPGMSRTLREAEEYFGKGTVERVVADIHSRYPRRRARDRNAGTAPRRILFLGTSQTWGAGARREEETFVARVEEMLNAGETGGRRYECVNAGFSSLKAGSLVPILRKELLSLRPTLLLINLSSNDRSSDGNFGSSVRRMVEAARRKGVPTVLVKEANDPGQASRGLWARFTELDQLGAELDVPVIDMHQHLAEFDDTGFLWWDHVHLTAYGQRLAAEKLAVELEPLLAALPAA